MSDVSVYATRKKIREYIIKLLDSAEEDQIMENILERANTIEILTAAHGQLTPIPGEEMHDS